MESTRPATISVNVDGIPDSIKDVDRWICWSWKWNGKKWDKPPLIARTGRMASSTKSETWCDFKTALDAHQEGRFDGIGFCLGLSTQTDKNYAGFDIDDCIVDGQIEPDAVYLASCIDSYTEVSPSGLGIKIFLIGELEDGGPKVCTRRGIEFYDGGRYFTVTGRHVEWSPRSLLERSSEFNSLRQQIFATRIKVSVRRTEKDLALLALKAINPLMADDYNEWVRVGMALKSVSDDLLDVWDDWSKISSKYVDGMCAKKWAGFRKGGLGIGSLIKWARDAGWEIPEEDEEYIGELKKPLAEPSVNRVHEREEQEEENQCEDEIYDDNDPHMGDGITEDQGSGPWRLMIEMSNPKRYWLKSPIWQESLALKRSNGYILLTKNQLLVWQTIRREAMDQAGVYVRPEPCKRPVWDGRKGPRLLRRLMASARLVETAPDFDRVLMAAEYIVDCGRKSGMMDKEKQDRFLGHRVVFRMEDGSIVFKLRGIAALAKKDACGFEWQDLREAASKYAELYWPESLGRRHRYYRFTSEHLDMIDHEISRKGQANVS